MMGLIAVSAMLAGGGCVSTAERAAPLHVTVSAAGVVRFQGRPVAIAHLAREIERAGAASGQEIRVHMESPQDFERRRQITSVLVSNKYRVLFVSAPRGVSEVVGDPASRVEAPARQDPPPGVRAVKP